MRYLVYLFWLLLALTLLLFGWAWQAGAETFLRVPVTATVAKSAGATDITWDTYSNYLAMSWTFDPLATNASGKIVDTSPSGSATGTLVGATWTINSAPRGDHSYWYDQIDDKTTVIPSILPSGVITAILITAWIKSDTYLSDYGEVICAMKNTSPYTIEIGFQQMYVDNPTKMYAAVRTAYTYTDNGMFVTGTWCHVAMSYNGADGYVRTWANGQASWLTMGRAINQTPTDGTYKLCVGSAGGALGRYFKGCIDGVRIYTNLALTTTAYVKDPIVSNIWYNTQGGLNEKGW